MVDWYRNKYWSEAIEAQFEAKLARARDKSQYLKLQGYALLDDEPAVAARLFERCAECDDHFKADALLYLGQARLRLGDVDGALDALDAAVEQEKTVAWARTGARSDRALIVAFHRRVERFDDTLAYLAAANSDPEVALAEELAAEALILRELGESRRARDRAGQALKWLDGLGEASRPDVGIGGGMSVAGLRERLRRIVHEAD